MRQAKLIQLAVLLLIVLILISALTYMISSERYFFGYFHSPGSDQNLNQMESASFSLSGIEDIELDIKSADIRIILTEGDTLEVVQKARKELSGDELLEITQSNDAIHISQPLIPNLFFFFHFTPRLQAVDIYLPASYHNNIKIKDISGDIRIDDDLTLKDLYIDQTSGDLDAAALEVNDFHSESVSGDLYITRLNCDDYSLDCTSGRIKVDYLNGKGNVDNISGDIILTYADIVSDADIQTVSGDISLSFLYYNGLELRAHTVSGDITADFANGLSGSFGKKLSTRIGSEPFYRLDLETVSGDIALSGK